MATVKKEGGEREILSTDGKAKVVWHTENGKIKSDMWQGFGLVNTVVQMIWKNRTKVICAFEQNE